MKEDKKNQNRIPFEMIILPALVGVVLYFAFRGSKSNSSTNTIILRPIKEFR